jgi:glycosyltransferase involved in cell wall biosynthesis
MRILFLAPQPFFQERGTPLAVRLALQGLAARWQNRREKFEIDLLVYGEGQEIVIPGVRQFRIKTPKFLRGVGPGISIKKIFCDIILFFTALRMVTKRKPVEQYQLIHAVEESVFIALFIKLFWRIPYVYDMDSSLSLQLVEKWWWMKPFELILRAAEHLAVRNSNAVVPVCETLAAVARRQGSPDLQILTDVSLLKESTSDDAKSLLRETVGAGPNELLIGYIGNLESYQGIDLLIESFALVSDALPEARLLIIGGTKDHIARYEQIVAKLGIMRVHLLGPRPVELMRAIIAELDILVSPRTKGNNTPMKIYSYLHSGKPILATDLPTHTQVLTEEVAFLAAPSAEAFSAGLVRLVRDPGLRARLGEKAQAFAEANYTLEVFERRLNELYDRLELRLGTRDMSPTVAAQNSSRA